jgi:ubiquinone biosynthesis protein UbiJ
MQEIGNVDLASRRLDEAARRVETDQEPARSSRVNRERQSEHDSEDRFTPSNNQGPQAAAQDPGLFQPSHVEFFSVTAIFFLAQFGTSQASQPAASNSSASGAPVPASAAPAPSATVTPGPATNPNVPPTLAPTAPSPAPTNTSGSPAGATTLPVATTPTSQDPLQALNDALSQLHLSPEAVQVFDQIASLIKSFSEAAFTALVSQLQALAQQATNGTTAAQGKLQMEELAIRFAALEEQGSPSTSPSSSPSSGSSNSTSGTSASQGTQATQGTQSVQGTQASQGPQGVQSTGGDTQILYFSLRIEEVNITLSNGAGQSVQLQAQAPPQTPGTNPPSAA